MAAMKSEAKFVKAIKPSSCTPLHLQTYKLPFLDQRAPNIFFNNNFFYPYLKGSSYGDDGDSNGRISNFQHASLLLQKSLSQTLTLFYPSAGRFQDDATIICNDEGVVFMESEANFSLSDILTSADLSIIVDHLLPTRYPEATANFHGCMILINFVLFTCGGTAICIENTHKTADWTTWMEFLKNWCALSKGFEQPIKPDLTTLTNIFPATAIPKKMEHSVNKYNSIMRRFVFRASKVQELKSKLLFELRKEGYENYYPSRVDAVTVLIWRCLMTSSKSKTGVFMPTMMLQAADLRRRMDPPLPQTVTGNMAWLMSMACEKESETELSELLKKIVALKGSYEELGKKINVKQLDEIIKEDVEQRGELFNKYKGRLGHYVCTALCKFGQYELDFAGMGKPVWMTGPAPEMFKNYINLMDTRVEGEVEALVYLDEEELNAFACNEELLQFAVVNPSVI